MGSEGFVYALVNPSIPGLIKVGRSTRGANERARELSGTSTPTPFVVIYEAAFRDCEAAERLVHTALESLGYRVSPNREFFDAPATAVVDAIRNAKDQDERATCGFEDAVAGGASSQQEAIWENVMRQANCALYGWDGELQDNRRALRLFEQAARLGAPEAFSELACLHGYGTPEIPANQERAIEWLKMGASRGARWCWAKLSDAYLSQAWSDISHPDNARKSLRRFFSDIRMAQFDDSQERECFFRLKTYLDLCAAANLRRTIQPDVHEDLTAINHAVSELMARIDAVADTLDRSARRLAISQLQERLMQMDGASASIQRR